MKKELQAPALIGTAVIALMALCGMFYFFLLRPEPIPEGKIDPTLPAPARAAGDSRFGPVQDNTGQPPPVKTTISAPSGN